MQGRITVFRRNWLRSNLWANLILVKDEDNYLILDMFWKVQGQIFTMLSPIGSKSIAVYCTKMLKQCQMNKNKINQFIKMLTPKIQHFSYALRQIYKNSRKIKP